MVEGKCREIAYFSSAMLHQKMQLLYQSIFKGLGPSHPPRENYKNPEIKYLTILLLGYENRKLPIFVRFTITKKLPFCLGVNIVKAIGTATLALLLRKKCWAPSDFWNKSAYAYCWKDENFIDRLPSQILEIIQLIIAIRSSLIERRRCHGRGVENGLKKQSEKGAFIFLPLTTLDIRLPFRFHPF